MENGEDEDGFNEGKARDLVYYLLENDTSVFKKLIPQIRAMDSNSFENLFMGTLLKETIMKKDIIIMFRIENNLKDC